VGIETNINLPNKVYYSEAFINSVHANKAVLLDAMGTNTITVDIHDALKFHGDLYGYLRARNIDVNLYPAILVLSNLNSQKDFSENVKLLHIPSITDLATLVEQINLSN
jgi:hypothetical protein